jgi:hypothetical protein
MYLECVTVCVNYADFLAITLPRNKAHFDDYVVVTTAEDRETRELCEAQGVRCVLTERLGHNGARFNKGCALNDGFAALARRDWVVILDADILLPDSTRDALAEAALDTRVLYAARRRVCTEASLWIQYQSSPHTVQLNRTLLDDSSYRQYGPGGTGYFAAFHISAPALEGMMPMMCEEYLDASKVDIDFAERWGLYRAWLSFDVIHIGPTQLNWKGRVTEKFI